MGNLNRSMSLAGEPPKALNTGQKLAVITGMTGMGILILQLFNLNLGNSALWLSIAILAIFAGIIWFSQAAYAHKHKGIKNDGVWFKSMSSRGVLAWMAGIALTGFYIVLYFYPQYLGLVKDGDNTGLIALFDPLSKALSGNPASQWFVYGTLYTVAILAFGAKFIWKYRHNKYEQLRTVSVMFFQTAFAFFIPEIMARLNGDLPYYDLKNMWPLNYYNFERYRINGFIDSGSVGMTMLFFGIISIFVISPFLTYKYGKRWYCSWVCGCGGLAETAGDSFRQLSDKSKFAWKVERWVVHSVVVFVTLMTTAVIYSYLGNDTSKYWLTKTMFISGVAIILTAVFAWVMIYKRDELEKDAKYGAIGYFTIIAVLIGMHFFSGSGNIFIFKAETLRSTYSFLIGSIFSGVIGTGFYPILGNRVWCRFGCPMAAILGFQQRMFSKFR
ncbi:MAG TPA: FeS-binding protein, partial [Maribacter sp.]|nr:FeS-binding protein [Maribacter sp.]